MNKTYVPFCPMRLNSFIYLFIAMLWSKYQRILKPIFVLALSLLLHGFVVHQLHNIWFYMEECATMPL